VGLEQLQVHTEGSADETPRAGVGSQPPRGHRSMEWARATQELTTFCGVDQCRLAGHWVGEGEEIDPLIALQIQHLPTLLHLTYIYTP